MKKKGWAAFLRRKQYLIAGALVVVAAIGTTVLYSNNQEQQRKQKESKLAQEMTQQDPAADVAVVEDETEESAAVSAVIPPETEAATETAEVAETTESTETEEKDSKVNETASKAKTLHFAPENGMLWPLKGNVVLNYSMDKTIYFSTLDQYKYNPAIVIAGDVNSKVYSVAKGQIKSIENNEVTGCTMTVDLGDGYQAVYGQLKEPNFAVGDYVESGHVLGYVSEPTKYFSVEGSNLYFELLKDGEPINPMEFLE